MISSSFIQFQLNSKKKNSKKKYSGLRNLWVIFWWNFVMKQKHVHMKFQVKTSIILWNVPVNDTHIKDYRLLELPFYTKNLTTLICFSFNIIISYIIIVAYNILSHQKWHKKKLFKMFFCYIQCLTKTRKQLTLNNDAHVD